ncbi:putative GABA transporter [Ixodes scapularis]
MDEDRSRWDRKAELVLCCLGVTMGVGNVWRFPKAVYEGGGGTFLLPYLVASLLLAKPLLCLEMCLGQFAGAGVLAVFQCCPLSRGLGASLCVQATGSALLGNVVLAYTLLYLYHSWSIPWETCSVDWGANMTTCFVADGRRCDGGPSTQMSPSTSSSTTSYASLSPATTGSTTDCRNGTELATYQYWYMDEDRSRWDRKAELVLCCLGVTMGVGNVWRFPKAVYEGGGGTFLLPYLVASLLLAKPLLCLEMCLGQFAGAGVLAVFQCCPLSRGLGASLCVQATGSALLGNVVLAYTLLYLYHSWSIPWETCSADWGANMTTCFVADGRMSPSTSSSTTSYASLSPATTGSTTDCRNGTELATYQYWYRHILGISDGLTDIRGLKMDITATFVIVWIHLFVFSYKGIETYRKLVYVTVLTPYLLLVVTLVVSVNLSGALEGLSYMLVPDWQRLADVKREKGGAFRQETSKECGAGKKNGDVSARGAPSRLQVWLEAAEQSLASLSLGQGTLLVLSSFSEFGNRTPRDAVLVASVDVVSCLLSCATVHAQLGHLSRMLGVSVREALPPTSGLGIAFVAVPEALLRMGGSRIWTFAFFVALYMLGLTASLILTEVVLSSLSDQFAVLRDQRARCSLIFCASCFVLGLPMCTNAGAYLFYLLEWSTSATNTVLICAMELVVINFGYGMDRLVFDLTFMMQSPPSRFWVFTWKYTAWPCLMVLCVHRLVWLPLSGQLKLVSYRYPWPAVLLGFVPVFLTMLPIPVWGWMMAKRIGWRASLVPNAHWGPAEPEQFSAYMQALGRSHVTTAVAELEPRPGLPPEAPLWMIGEPPLRTLADTKTTLAEPQQTPPASPKKEPRSGRLVRRDP